MADGAGVIFGLDWGYFGALLCSVPYVCLPHFLVWRFRGGFLLFAPASCWLFDLSISGKELQGWENGDLQCWVGLISAF
jgi:hypothetical protein